jgi:hypothetical protein
MSNDLIDMRKLSSSMNRKLWLITVLSVMSLLQTIWFTLHPSDRRSSINHTKGCCQRVKAEM